MPDGYGKPPHRDDPYGWALAQAEIIRALPAGTTAFDRDGPIGFLEESANSTVAAVKSQLINRMAHLTKSACTRNADVIGHWRTECQNFHQDIIVDHRRSMRKEIDMERGCGGLQRSKSSLRSRTMAGPPPPCPRTAPSRSPGWWTRMDMAGHGGGLAGALERRLNRRSATGRPDLTSAGRACS